MLRWMRLSIMGLMLLALMVPIAIFGTGWKLLAIAFAFYAFIFYLVDSFCYYLTSNAPANMQEAEENADEVEQEREADRLSDRHTEPSAPSGNDDYPQLTVEAVQAIDEAVAAWTARGGHLTGGLLMPLAAADIGVPKYRLTCWLHQKQLKYTEWIAALRVDEAKRLIREHPDWSNEAIAQHCGFTERTLLRTFKRLTGLTPAQFAKHA